MWDLNSTTVKRGGFLNLVIFHGPSDLFFKSEKFFYLDSINNVFNVEDVITRKRLLKIAYRVKTMFLVFGFIR